MRFSTIDKNSWTLLTVFVVLVAATVPALSQDTRPDEARHADARLNEVYQRLLGQLNAPAQAKLRKAQRAWIAYRDLDCIWEYDAVSLDCQIQRTVERTDALEEALLKKRPATSATDVKNR